MKKLTALTLTLFLISFSLFAQNPQLLKDVFPGNNSGTIQNIVKTTGYTFFNEDDDDADADRSLFRTDGTNAGTIKLNLTYPGYVSTKAEMLTPLGNKVVFAGDNFQNYGEIWASDGTQAGTVAIERFQPINNKVPVVEIKTMGSYSYYSVINKSAVDNLNHAYLRRTDGSAGGTSLVYDFSAFTGVPQVVFLTPVNNILYFIVYDAEGTGVDQLWRSDGTVAGTSMVYNFTTANFVESFIMPVGNTLYLMIGSVVGGVRQNTIWKSDGTTAGTVPVKLVGTGNANTYPPFAVIGSTLYFAGVDGNGKELWQTDGSAAGTYMVADINPGAGSSNPLSFAVLNNTLYFSAATPTSGGELWKYNSGVASLVKDINPGSNGSGPGQLTVSGNTILFNANNGTNGGELWITDGTFKNTVMVADINPFGNSVPNTFTTGNPVYFAANNGTSGFEVYKYDNNGDVLSGPRKYYVNDNSITGDVFTTGVGNNNNNGSKAYPFATISYAVTQVQPGDSIYVDAGTYVEQVTLDKGITIIGAGQDLTSILKPAITVAPPGPFTEQGVIQTAQNIGDVHIKDLSVTGDYNVGVTPIIIQSGGSVKNCKLQNGNQGIFVRVDPATNPSAKTFVLENSTVSAEYIGANIEGTNLTATLTNNTIGAVNTGFSAGLFVGADFGPLGNFTATGNFINSYSSFGLLFSAASSSITQNSIVGINGVAIQKNGGNTINATCNWYGSSDPVFVFYKMVGAINYSPWLSSGVDGAPAIGFQPLAGACNGRQNKFYVNDAYTGTDILTYAAGNDNNPGFAISPFATINKALSVAQSGDSIFVDAGTYNLATQLTINKSITILGSNYTISPNDNANKYLANASRNADSKITGAAFVVAADYINFKGLRFSPTSGAISQNGNYSHIKIEKSYFDVIGTGNTVNFQGSSVNPIVAFDFSITDSRFERTDLSGGNSVNLGLVKSIWIDNNVFIEAPASGNPFRGFGVRTVFTQSVESTVFSNNYVKKLQVGVLPTMIKDWTINNNVFDSCTTGINHAPANTVSNNIFIRSNTFTNTRVGRSILVRGGTNGGVNNYNIIDNTLNQEVDGINGVVGMIQLDFAASSNNGTATISGNRLNLSGNYDNAFFKTQCGIMLMGKHNNTTISDNELNFTAINTIFNPSAVLPSIPTGIFINTDGGTGSGPIPAGSVINITNNKINGFKSSVGLYDPTSTGLTPTVGYGYLTNGATVNINNNSFTGDSISISNGTASQPVNASCNWYGSAAAQDFINKLSLSTVDIVPWLTNGTDNSAATGFQPVAGSCDGYPTLITLDNYTNVTCNGAANGTINITVGYGKAPFTYTWTKEGDENFVSHTEDQTNLTLGTYHLSLVDGNGTNIYITDPEADGPGTIDVTITEPTLLTAPANGTNVSCFGGSNGTASVTAGGGTTPYSYLWSNGGTNATINNLTAGLYTVTVTDGNGCTKTANYQVTQPAVLTAVATGTSTSCANSATVAASGGTVPYSYSWSNGATTQSITSLPTGTYTVTVTDGNGCQTTASCSVTGNQAFNPSTSITDVSCFGGSNGSITITNVNGTAPYQYSLDGINFQSSNVIGGLSAGTYTITVRDANGCTGFVTKTVSQPIAPLAAALGTVQSTCAGSSTGSISVSVSGGSPSYSYSWSGPNGYTSTQLNISGLAVGNYSLAVTDSKGCTAVLPVTVSAYPSINVSANITNVTCNGANNGSIDLTVTGGSGSGFTYSWNNGVATTEDRFNLAPGTNYKVTITDIGSGCQLQNITYSISQPAALGINTNTSYSSDVNGCISMGVINVEAVGGTAPYQYKLNYNGTYQSSGLFQNLPGTATGIIDTVWIKDSKGCTFFKSYTIKDDGKDSYENNNSKNNAAAISLGTTISARIGIAGDFDYFKLSPTNTWSGNYTLSFVQPSVAVIFDLVASNGSTIIPPASSGTNYKQYNIIPGGTYFVRVSGSNSSGCYQLTVSSGFLTRSAGSNIQQEITKPAKDLFNVAAFPNPSNSSFNVKVESNSEETMNLRVMDASGRLIEERKNIPASQIVKLGGRYINGVYLVEIIQGNNHKNVRLVKM